MSDFEAQWVELDKAAAAGDTAKAKQITAFLQKNDPSLQSQASPATQEKPLQGVSVAGLEMAAEAISDQFRPKDPHQLEGAKLIGASAGSAAGGAIAGAVLPSVLGQAGKVVPGWAGKAMQGLSAALSKIPASQRIAEGATGGAASGVVGEVADSFGAPPIVKSVLEAVAGGVGAIPGKMVAGALVKSETKALVKHAESDLKDALQAAGNAATGSATGLIRGIRNLVGTGKNLDMQAARDVQAKMFGKDAGGLYLKGEADVVNRAQTFEALRKADPSLGATAASNSMKDPAQSLLGAAPQAASEIYRDRLSAQVAKTIEETGNKFSVSPSAQHLHQDLKTLVDSREIPVEEARQIVEKLSVDRSKNPEARARYGKVVLDLIRNYGNEGKSFDGTKAISAGTAATVKKSLEASYKDWLEASGMGDAFGKTQKAYQQEMLAKAKDYVPVYLDGYAPIGDFEKVARNLVQDPHIKPFLQQSISTHLARANPSQIMRQFDRLDKVLVNSELVTGKDMINLRKQAEVVKGIADDGLKLKLAHRFQQFVLMSMARQAGGAAGGAVAGGAQE